MTTSLEDPAVRGYLAELNRLLEGLPDRGLIVDGVAQHIHDALAGTPVDAARVRAVLEELGDPAVIAAEARSEATSTRPSFLQRRSGATLTVALLTLGGFVVPVAGWIVGLGLLWSSKGWTVGDKLIGTFAPFVLAAVLLAVAAGVDAITAVHLTHLALLLGLFAGAVLAAVLLLRRFNAATGG